MTQDRRPRSEQHIAMEAAARAGPETQALPDAVEAVIAPAIERALDIYVASAMVAMTDAGKTWIIGIGAISKIAIKITATPTTRLVISGGIRQRG